MTFRLSLICLLLTGCTVIPRSVPSEAPSVSGNDSSPPIRLPDKSESVNAGDEARYEALIKIYGTARNAAGLPYFLIPLHKGDGVKPDPDRPGRFIIDEEHMIDFALMAGWYRQARQK